LREARVRLTSDTLNKRILLRVHTSTVHRLRIHPVWLTFRSGRYTQNPCRGILSAIAICRQCTACICGFGIESDAYDRVLPRPAVVSCLRTSVPLGAGETSRI
jgi:hypothetical protein